MASKSSQMLAMKTPGGLWEGGRETGGWLSLRSVYQALGRFSLLFSCLLSFPSPQFPPPLEEFYFSLMVGVRKRLLATPAAGLGALPALRGQRML